MSLEHSLQETVRRILQTQEVGVLTTQGEDYPHACLVAFAATEDLGTIVFSTSRTTRKFTNINTNDRVTLLVDDRVRQEEDFHQATVVTARGQAGEIPQGEKEPLLDLFLQQHPYLEQFAASPTSVLVGIRVKSYGVVSRFQNVLILDLET